MLLSQYGVGRDNNFNLLRFIAASLVLLSHSFALSTGSAAAEPLRESLGVTWGVLAVDVFFITSGFLVTGSLLARGNVAEFVVARVLRIYPGLWIALALTVFVAGAWVTRLGLGDFLAHPGTWAYLLKNGSVMATSYTLPGVFEDLPWKDAVNGSLWTLPVEVKMYAALALIWLVALKLPGVAARNFQRICIAVALGTAFSHLLLAVLGRHENYARLSYMFFSGAALRMLQDHVQLSARFAVPLIVAVLVSATSKAAFEIVYPICIPYLVLFLAFVPDGAIRGFNRLGDYSYGIYIYAFPVQQLSAFHWPGIGPYEMMAVSFTVTLILAIGSWTLIEKRALALKQRVGAIVRGESLRAASR